MTEDQKNKFAKLLGIPDETRDVLNTGSAHPYNCRCETCRQWWKAMGPDDGTGRHGPFTDDEIAKP